MSVAQLVIGFLVVLGPLVFFHELGHFLVAKWAGIRVVEFGFGFPPRMFKFWQSRGRLAVNGIRVNIPANFKDLPPSAVEFNLMEAAPQAAPDKKQAAPVGVAIGDNVEVIADCTGPNEYRLHQLLWLDPSEDDLAPMRKEEAGRVQLRGQVTEYVPGTIYSVNWLLPLGGFVRMLGEEDPTAPDSFAAAPKRRRAAALLAGPLTNVLLAVIIITAAWMVGYQQAVTCQVEVTGINSGSPAEQAGLQPGDLILQVDAEPIDGCGELTTYISARKGQQVTLSVKRGVSILIPWQAWICAQVDRCALVAQASDQTLQIPIVPRTDGQYNPAREGPLGVTVLHHATSWETQQVGLIDALIGTAGIIQTMVAGMLSLPAALVSGAALAVLGPIGISQAGSEAIEQSIRYGTLFPILMLIGQVSVAVGLTNLLPLPALDGGRLLFIVVEWLRGRRVEPRKEMIVHLVGLGLLVLVALLVSYGDIMRLINNQSILK